jgi:hypothetical protein
VEATTEQHKFLADSPMSYEQVFGFTVRYPARLLMALANKAGKEEFLATLEAVSMEMARQDGANNAGKVAKNDMATFQADMVDPNSFWRHALTYDIVENTEHAFEVKVTECLWAQAYRACGAPEIGYAMWCHSDFGRCQGFNPKMRMERTKTLMQGDNCCNHRWILDE